MADLPNCPEKGLDVQGHFESSAVQTTLDTLRRCLQAPDELDSTPAAAYQIGGLGNG